MVLTGHSNLVATCLTAVCEVLISINLQLCSWQLSDRYTAFGISLTAVPWWLSLLSSLNNKLMGSEVISIQSKMHVHGSSLQADLAQVRRLVLRVGSRVPGTANAAFVMTGHNLCYYHHHHYGKLTWIKPAAVAATTNMHTQFVLHKISCSIKKI